MTIKDFGIHFDDHFESYLFVLYLPSLSRPLFLWWVGLFGDAVHVMNIGVLSFRERAAVHATSFPQNLVRNLRFYNHFKSTTFPVSTNGT